MPVLHEWDVTPAQARRIQAGLADQVKLRPLPAEVRSVAGADVAFSRTLGRVYAAVVVCELPSMALVERVTAGDRLGFPYVPGLLTFREGPVLLKAFRRLRVRPDVVIFDGQGYAHPARFGLASHMGLWTGLPSVGCAKSRLTGRHAEPGPRRGDSAPLLDDGEQIGVVLRTREGVKPVYVSPGHLADLATSCRLVLACCTRYRLPEPTRQAHLAVSRFKAQQVAGLR